VLARKNTCPGDILIAVQGAGGGTVTAAALFYGRHNYVRYTLDITALRTAIALMDAPEEVKKYIHTVIDISNGGIRGDLHELAKASGCRLSVRRSDMDILLRRELRKMLEELEIDFLGISTGALLISVHPEGVPEIEKLLHKTGAHFKQIGKADNNPGNSFKKRNTKEKTERTEKTEKKRAELEITSPAVMMDGKPFLPMFREEAYTPIKKVVASRKAPEIEQLKKRISDAYKVSLHKKKKLLRMLV
ncbi:MAG: AIR synthase-related protein, partial [Thermoplasmata archaeon]